MTIRNKSVAFLTVQQITELSDCVIAININCIELNNH